MQARGDHCLLHEATCFKQVKIVCNAEYVGSRRPEFTTRIPLKNQTIKTMIDGSPVTDWTRTSLLSSSLLLFVDRCNGKGLCLSWA